MVFYSEDENFYEKVLENIKKSFKNIGKIERNFVWKMPYEKNIKIKKHYKENSLGILI